MSQFSANCENFFHIIHCSFLHLFIHFKNRKNAVLNVNQYTVKNMNIIEHAMNNYASTKINPKIMKYFKKYITYNLMLANSYCIY